MYANGVRQMCIGIWRLDYVSPICTPAVGVDSARYWNTSTGVCAKMNRRAYSKQCEVRASERGSK